MLTRKQLELLKLIDRRLRADGVPPSFEEMKDAIGLRSKSGIHRLITALEERGFIRRLPHKARAIEVLKLPEGIETAEARTQTPDNVIPLPRRDSPAPVSLPLYGRIAAGTPIEALRDPSASIEVPPALVGRGNHYALEIAGDSMIEAGINDGDLVIIRETGQAESGDIVVALIDDGEATLKRYRRRGGSIALEPANPGYETRILPPERVKVQGRLVGLLRRY